MRIMQILLGAALGLMAMPAFAYQTITCISENDAFTRCNLSNADERNVQINNIKSGNCNQSNAWGTDSTSVWVDKGCGATFQYTSTATSSNSSSYSSTGYSSEGPNIVIAPGIAAPYYGPYYGGYYGDYNNSGVIVVDGNGDHHNNYNNNYNHPNYQHSHMGNYGGGGGHRR